MRFRIASAALGTLSLALAQTPPGPPAFEVASVKHLAPDSGEPGSNLMRGGPGSADPGRITFPSVTLKRLLMAAYGVEVDQISAPGWLDSERYSVEAKFPPGATREQLKVALQTLIAERFHMTLHQERKDFSGYELVAAKRGAKLKPSVEGVIPAHSLDGDGFPPAPPGRYAATRTGQGMSRLSFNRYSMADLAGVLGMPLGGLAGNRVAAATIVDKTGFTEKYDFTLEFAGYMGPGGAFPPATETNAPNLFEALETQLGLRLMEKKVPRDILVIDSIDRVPVEN
jgi:uncharacterized protein (TIGR03435 family)